MELGELLPPLNRSRGDETPTHGNRGGTEGVAGPEKRPAALDQGSEARR